MESFNNLFNQYVQRSGISDAELARAVGVSRQTIFRWREGLTGRPRHRDDILVIAHKLRLTPAERDTLLLAAGFRPEQAEVQVETGEVAGETVPSPLLEPVVETQPQRTASEKTGQVDRPARPGNRIVFSGLGLLTVFLAAVWGVNLLVSGPSTPEPPVTRQTIATPAPEETVILITHFANYASDQVGYNVAGRLAEALQREIDTIAQENIRVEVWAEAVDRRDEALQAGAAVSATLVIYGQYDAGRVVVAFAHPPDHRIFADPALRQHMVNLEDLSTAINSDLPRRVRSLALIALGQVLLGQDEAERARPLLIQARNNLQNDPGLEDKTWAVANFYLGLAYYRSDPPELDAAILAYNQAVASWPQMISSRLNRIAALEDRNSPGDLDQALADAEAVVRAAPDWGAAYNNRASIRLTMGGSENLALALDDLDQALALSPDLPEAYLNRATARFGQGQTMAEVVPDVERALDLRPDYGSALNLLCWGYSLEQQVETALPNCQRAVNTAPDEVLFRDSRGLAHALLGDYAAAIKDFEAYAGWLEVKQPGPDWERDLMRRRAWIAALEVGQNPFTPEILDILRREMGE